jgi:hypothetical protein
MKALQIGIHLIVILILTIVSQIGGLIYLISILSIKASQPKYKLKRLALFATFYLIANQILVPLIAPKFGRERIKNTQSVESATALTTLLNRDYVSPELNAILTQTGNTLNNKYNQVKLIYLDANFPFLTGFPLFPHLSHNDGNKVDLSFIYKDNNNQLVNKKPSRSGYGVFTDPITGEENTTGFCKSKGYWQYDYPKYLTFGQPNKDLQLAENETKFLIEELLKHSKMDKIFIEPHLKSRLKLTNDKIRFHGCGAVRHDDHIHIQIKR